MDDVMQIMNGLKWREANTVRREDPAAAVG
jgi:hypothetical protein